MENELKNAFPSITKSDGGKEVVNARELWKALESTTEYAKWIKRRITENEFAIFGEDYVELSDNQFLAKNGENYTYGRPSKEYALTLDFAKRISMMEKTAKSEMVRKYFVECEKQLKEMVQSAPRLPKNYKEALVELLAQVEENERLMIESQEKDETIKAQSLKIEEDKPKVEFAENLLLSNDTISIRELSKLICNNGYVIGPIQLFNWLRTNGYLGVSESLYNLPTQQYVKSGFFKIKESPYKNNNGEIKISKSTRVTPKGQQHFLKLFNVKNNNLLANNCNSLF